MKGSFKRTLRVYWDQMSGSRWVFFVLVAIIIFGTVCNAIVPIYLKRIVDAISLTQDKDISFKLALSSLFMVGAIEMARVISNRGAGFWYIRFLSKFMAKVSNYSFQYLHRHSFSFFANNFSGALVKKVNYLTRAAENIFDSFVWDFVPMFTNLSVILSVLSFRDWRLGAGVFVWLVLFFTVTIIFSGWKFKYDIIANEAVSKTTGFLADTITNFSSLKLFNGYNREIGGFAELQEDLRRKNNFAWSMNEVFNAVSAVFMVVLEVGLLWMSIKLWKNGLFTPGDFVLIQSYVIIVVWQSWHFGHLLRNFYRSFSDAEEMVDILNTTPDILDIHKAKKLKVDKGEIEFRKVGFCYHETRKVLNDFDLTIKAGEKVALIGPSGAGKTTVVKLLLRNFDLTSGHILIDGQDIARATQESLWSNISLVPQDPVLFHRTLAENIAYGRPEASKEEIIKASKQAHCHEFISNLPEGYDTYVGERGIKLSGGERQRVAIARAILRNAPILVLDEATSSLDSESESLIQDALEKLMKNKTVIVIAHRLSTIREMDRIIYIDGGKIMEDGRHEDLEKKENGLYKHLWEIQAGGFVNE